MPARLHDEAAEGRHLQAEMLEHLGVEALVPNRDQDEGDPAVEAQPGGGSEAKGPPAEGARPGGGPGQNAPPADGSAAADDLAAAEPHDLGGYLERLRTLVRL